MNKEKTQIIIKEVLEKMGCSDISFTPSENNIIIATFNCKEITSFVANIQNWTYSGIHLDPTKEHQYKIDFKEISK